MFEGPTYSENTIRTPLAATSSLPHLTKKKTMSPPRLEPKNVDPLVPKTPQNRRGKDPQHQNPREITVEHVHKALLRGQTTH